MLSRKFPFSSYFLNADLAFDSLNIEHKPHEGVIKHINGHPHAHFRRTNLFQEFRKEEEEQALSDRFELQAAEYPDRLAVKSVKHELTYSELNNAANRVSHAIRALSGEGNVPIALLVEFGAPEIIGLLGILKAGKALVGLPVTYPRARNSYILEHSFASLIVTDNINLWMAKELSTSMQSIINIDDLDAGLSEENLNLSISPDDIAAIIYTSGTTGQPKGVIQNHRNLLHVIRNGTNYYQICPDDRVAVSFSYAFVGGLINILRSLLNGASVLLFNLKDVRIDDLANLLIDEEITRFSCNPTTFRNLTNSLNGTEKFLNIRTITLGGEVLYPKDVEMHRNCFPPECPLINKIGCTEAPAFCVYLINKDTQIKTPVVPIGCEEEGFRILLWDEGGNEVGVNQVGEMILASRYLSPGYWRQPELTKAAFLPDPKGGNERLFMTGDLGIRLPDGSILHLGRSTSQVKIRGHRVEVAEIEMTILSSDWIKEVAVKAQENRFGEQMLVAYIVPTRQPAFSVSAIRREIAQKLPDYMIPSAFVILNAMPLNPTGKVDYQALPMPSGARPDIDGELVLPRNDTEKRMVEIWKDLLGIDVIGVYDDFFDLGGNSLLAARLLIQIENAFCKKLSLATIFLMPTVEKIAKILLDGEKSEAILSLVPIQTHGSRFPFFCILGINVLRVLSHHLGPEQPIYGLVPLNWGDPQTQYNRIEQMAHHYLQGIRTLQPEGPYFLGGHSFGGLVAFEMARQLQMQGQKVQLLVVIDTYPVPVRKYLIFKFLLYRMLYLLRSFQINRIFAFMVWKRRGVFPITSKEVHDKHYWSTIKRAFDRYEVKAYPGNIVLFKAGEIIPEYSIMRDARLDWAKLATGNLDVHDIPGNHETILREPNIQVLAEKLKACLDQTASRNESRELQL
jgi:amino acid adenylation domain-containing protein